MADRPMTLLRVARTVPGKRSGTDHPATDLVVEALSGVPGPEWDARVAALGGYAFHSRAYALASGDLGEEPMFLVLRRGERPAGFAVALRLRTRVRPLGWARDVLRVPSPPVLEEDVSRTQALGALAAFAARHRMAQLEVNAYGDSHPEHVALVDVARVRWSPRLDYRVALGADFESTVARMGATHRRHIRRAMDIPFTFEERSDREGARLMHAVHLETFARRRALGQSESRAWSAAEFHRRMDAYIERGVVRFHFTRLDGEIVSAIGTMSFGRTSYYLVGGTTRAGFERNAAYAMFAHTMRRLIAEGVTEFSLGGTGAGAADDASPEHGLYRFKKGYGARVCDCPHVRIRVTGWRWWPVAQ